MVERAGGCGMAKKVRTVYREPEDFIPEKVRRELKLGEFAQGEEEKKDEKPEGSEPSEEKGSPKSLGDLSKSMEESVGE